MDSLEVLLNVKTEGMSKVRAEFEATSKVASKTSSKVKEIKKQTGALSKKTKEYSKNIQKQKDLQKQAFDLFNTESRKEQLKLKATNELLDKKKNKLKALQGTLLGLGFSMLFGGMAIANFFEGITRSIFNVYALAEGQTSAFGVATAKLQGAWAYLKYSIVEALMSTDLVWNLIDWAIAFIDKLAEMPDWGKKAFVHLIFGAWIAGRAMQILGQLIMLTVGVLALIALKAYIASTAFGAAFAAKHAERVTALATAIKSVALWIWRVLLPLVAWVALIAVIIALGISLDIIWENISDALVIRFKQVGNAFKTFTTLFLAGWKKFGIITKIFIANFKEDWLDMVNYIGDKLASGLNKMIGLYNSVVKPWARINAEIEYVAISTTGLQDTVTTLQLELEEIDKNTITVMAELYDENVELRLGLQDNLEEAGEALAKGWETVMDSLTGKTTEVEDALGTSNSAGTSNTDNSNSVVVNNHIEISGDSADFGTKGDALVATLESLTYQKYGVTKSK